MPSRHSMTNTDGNTARKCWDYAGSLQQSKGFSLSKGGCFIRYSVHGVEENTHTRGTCHEPDQGALLSHSISILVSYRKQVLKVGRLGWKDKSLLR